jgi:hypothetical protein
MIPNSLIRKNWNLSSNINKINMNYLYRLFVILIFLSIPFLGIAQIQQCNSITLCPGEEVYLNDLVEPDGGTFIGLWDGGIYEGTQQIKDWIENQYAFRYKYMGDSCDFVVTSLKTHTAGNISGNSIPCKGTTEIYQTIEDASAINYIWFSEEFLSANDTTQIPQVSIYFNNSLTFTLNVKIENTCGIGAAKSYVITVKQASLAEIKNVNDTLSNIDQICQNERLTYALKVNGTTLSDIEWTASGGEIIGSATSPTVTVQWGATIGQSSLSATYKDDLKGCYGSADRTVQIQEGVAPLAPEIWLFGDSLLVCSNDTASDYEWYVIIGTNIAPIPNSNKPYLYTGYDYASYYVKICNDACCNRSPIYSFAAIQESDPVSFSIFPNPARDKITIRSDEPLLSEFNYSIYSQLGLELSSGVGTKGLAEVNIAYLPAGFYLIRVWSDNSARFSQKILKF